MTEPLSSAELKAIMEFVAHDSEEFSIEKFMAVWPTDTESQRIAQAALLARTSRTTIRNSKSVTRLWLLSSFSVVCSILALGIATGVDPIMALSGALLAGGISRAVTLFTP